MWLTIMIVSSWFIQARHLKKIWFVLTCISFFLICFFSWSAGQTQCPIILLAMLVGSSNMLARLFGIIQACVMVLFIFLRKKNKNSCCMCPALPPDPDLPAAREKVISNCLSFIWKGIWPGLWIQLSEMKLILLYRPKCKQWNKLSCSSGTRWIQDRTNP